MVTRLFPEKETTVLDAGTGTEALPYAEAAKVLEYIVDMLARISNHPVTKVTVKERAEPISGQHSYDINVSYMVTGETIKERIEFLREYVDNLRKELESGEALVQMLTMERDTLVEEPPNGEGKSE